MLGKTLWHTAIASQATPQKSRDYTKVFWHNPHLKLNFSQSCYFLLKLFAKSSLLSPVPPFLPQKLFPGRMKNVRNVAGHLLTDGLPAAWQKNAFPAVGETLFFYAGRGGMLALYPRPLPDHGLITAEDQRKQQEQQAQRGPYASVKTFFFKVKNFCKGQRKKYHKVQQ